MKNLKCCFLRLIFFLKLKKIYWNSVGVTKMLHFWISYLLRTMKYDLCWRVWDRFSWTKLYAAKSKGAYGMDCQQIGSCEIKTCHHVFGCFKRKVTFINNIPSENSIIFFSLDIRYFKSLYHNSSFVKQSYFYIAINTKTK